MGFCAQRVLICLCAGKGEKQTCVLKKCYSQEQQKSSSARRAAAHRPPPARTEAFSFPTAGGGAGGSTSNHRRFRHLQGKCARMAEKQGTFAVKFHCKALKI